MSYVIVGIICAIVGFAGGVFVAIRYLGDWTDYVMEKYNQADGQLDSVVEQVAAWIKRA